MQKYQVFLLWLGTNLNIRRPASTKVKPIFDKSHSTRMGGYYPCHSFLSREIQKRLRNLKRPYGKFVFSDRHDSISIRYLVLILRSQVRLNYCSMVVSHYLFSIEQSTRKHATPNTVTRNGFPLLHSHQIYRSLPIAEKGFETCPVPNANTVSKNMLECFLPDCKENTSNHMLIDGRLNRTETFAY